MKKLQLFYVYKFLSSRLKNNKYSLQTDLQEARKNDEVITIANSEMIRSLFRFLKKEYSQEEVDELLISKKRLRRKNEVIEVLERLDEILFIPQFVNVEFTNKNHYLEILKRGGFYVNGKLFVPFTASAGMVRRNTALFIDDEIRKDYTKILECGRDKSVEIVPAKWNAYFSLYSSSSLPVSFPRFAIVKDCIIKTNRVVDFVTYRGVGWDDSVEEKETELECNAFDGGGLISPALAEKWSTELGLDYTSSTFIIRGPFLKGMVATFDFHEFAKSANKRNFTDIYGKVIDVSKVDLIVSESMAKLWGAYRNTDDYIYKCFRNNLGFGVSKVSPKIEKNTTKTSYQFLQILNLDDEDIKKLCEPTLNWFRALYSGNAQDMVLFSVGDNNREFELFDLDYVTQALVIDESSLADEYIFNHFKNALKKKVKQSFMGNIMLHGNYQIMVSDPYAFAEHVFGLPVKGLLAEYRHYSNYWNEQNVNQVAAIRSPAVHNSEVNILNLQNRKDVNYWYKYIKSGIIYPAYGIGLDMSIHGGSDTDGDTVMTTDNSEVIKGKIQSLPIFYKTNKASKEIIDTDVPENLVKSQILGYNSQVGYATNISTSLYALLSEFEENSEERKTIERRLKILRAIQGEIIDSAKGLEIPPFRYHWVKYADSSKLQDDEKDRQDYYNSILCDKRPMYFKFLYDDYNRRYNKEIESYNNIAFTRYGLSFQELLDLSDKTPDQIKICENYKKFSYFLNNNSVMNKISRYMQKSLKNIDKGRKFLKYDYSLFTDACIDVDPEKKKEFLKLYREYKSNKSVRKTNSFTSEQFVNYIRKKAFAITGNIREIANISVEICYSDFPGGIKDFAWRIAGDGMIMNLLSNTDKKEFYVPVLDSVGNIEYLWNKYSLKKLELDT